MALDERLRQKLERAARPADPSGVYEHMIRRRERRRIARKVQSGVLAVAVVTGSIGGAYGLSRVFRKGTPQEPAAPGVSNGVIVFSRDVPGEGEHLFAASPDGLEIRRLTPVGRAVYRSPDLSPEGGTIVVAHEIPSFEPGPSVLATLPIEGGSPTWLTEEAWVVRDPTWSPDGGRIAFAGSPGGRFGIYVFDVEAGDVRLVPGTDDNSVGHPAWSPDGSRIAFDASTGSDIEIEQMQATWDVYSVAVDGTGMMNLTNTRDLSETQPAWSWALDRIAFVESGPAEGALLTMGPTGGEVMSVYSGELAPANPVWAPDGTAIAFEGGSEGIVTVASDGAGSLVVPNIDGREPSWQPVSDGTSVVPSPSPTESPLPEGAEDIGLGFPVCFAERLGRIDYLGDGADGNAWTAVHLEDDGTCPGRGAPAADRWLLAVDHTGDRISDSWIDLPFECSNLCAPLDATDLDGNGTEELIIVNSFSIMDYSVFAVRPSTDGDLRVEPILVAAPGHRPAQIVAGEPLRISAGGDAGYGSSIECEGYPSAPVIVWSWSYAEIDGDEATEVHVARIELQPDGLFHVIDTNDYTVPAGEPSGIADPYELGPQCGVDWYGLPG